MHFEWKRYVHNGYSILKYIIILNNYIMLKYTCRQQVKTSAKKS